MRTRGSEPLKHRKNAGIVCGSRTCKPNSVRLAAGRSFLWAAHYCAAQATYPEVVAHRAGTRSFETEASQELPPYLVLLRVGFALPAALLRRRCALTAPFHPYLSLAARAVCFLWHFPSNDPAYKSAGVLPDVIRHTALRSSDFPPVLQRATVRSGYQPIHYSARQMARTDTSDRWRVSQFVYPLELTVESTSDCQSNSPRDKKKSSSGNPNIT